jgi:hypothetical protein
MSILAYLKARLEERSTYMLVFASLGSAAALAHPFNWISFGLLLAAALTPDGTVASK